ncbi:hypothetical protein [Aureimonas phyllosphaerae]|uniref:Uncharacterized protein (DUF2336 family) n=1 Tax=Aureimonas phyllosphaerae TaxID=1166078 RepID=A0A7W6BSZ3_9HYPH|nr:hypothetical protein [Aureimonas phyllosphaerae]MBB3934483.1 uncharacterized protein (DUF2336 family) [Aureimonas phyllosphaerae]MBB3958301.1 uncharacterized protein (DUF2336 family) [Aureimonas phyllosphaerae]SFE94973.1 hypothetical protein SAMN05216566_101271 [Aureimonas phyllosphaerae]
MKDAAPRIFRSLERQPAQQQFDTVVTAAITAYGALRHPTQRQADDMARLVVPLWGRIGSETRRNAAAALSHSARVPRSLVDLLVAEPIEVSAPFLISSPVLEERDLAHLSATGDERVIRLLDNRTRRAEGPAPVPAVSAPAAAETAAAEPAAAAATAAQPDSPSLAPEFLAETPLLEPVASKRRQGPSVDGVREALRRLALTGRTSPQVQPVDTEALLLLAMERQEAAFYDMLSQALPIDGRTVLEIAADPTGERLAVALKALKTPSADAMSIMMMLKPAVGLEVLAFDRLALFYRTLKVEDCRSMVNAARLQPAARAASEGIRSFEPGRREFGRRTERPAPREAQG